MKLWVYTLCWNEEKILPYFLRHYGEWLCADKIIIHDNESTDNSLAVIKEFGHLDIEVRSYGTKDLDSITKIRNECWHEARGKADWVLIVDMDEFLFHNDIFGFFDRCEKLGVDIVRPYGFEMISRTFPVDNGKQIWEMIRTGVQCGLYSKPCLFRPDRVVDISYAHGAHDCEVIGTTRYMPSGSCRLLHYKHLSWEYFWQRTEELRERADPVDMASGYSVHYLRPMTQHLEEFNRMLRYAVDVVT